VAKFIAARFLQTLFGSDESRFRRRVEVLQLEIIAETKHRGLLHPPKMKSPEASVELNLPARPEC
jgi:hypothetical protein